MEETKQEIRDMENLYSSHNTHSITHQDDNKTLQKLKQMELCLDLTKQKCQKAEARVKELENENRQLKGAETSNGSLLEEREKLRQQVHTYRSQGIFMRIAKLCFRDLKEWDEDDSIDNVVADDNNAMTIYGIHIRPLLLCCFRCKKLRKP